MRLLSDEVDCFWTAILAAASVHRPLKDQGLEWVELSPEERLVLDNYPQNAYILSEGDSHHERFG